MLLPTTLKSAATERQLGRSHKAAMGARKRRNFFMIGERFVATIYMLAAAESLAKERHSAMRISVFSQFHFRITPKKTSYLIEATHSQNELFADSIDLSSLSVALRSRPQDKS